MEIRVRFAPSPTGMLHVGALRDALFKQLLAEHNGGVNILRIEDTDRTRYNRESEDEFIKTLAWAGITFNEGPHIGGPHAPYRQSERKEAGIYQKYIDELLAVGGAYKAFETPEMLAEMREYQQINKMPTGYFGGEWRDASPEKVAAAEAAGLPYVIREKVRRGRKIVIEDLIRGRIEWDSDTIDDAVLIKQDGMPTYHFAAMVDDHLMGITHILRGEEWISSAPKHAELFDLFGWERPIFVHCPVIVGNDGKKLSKRHGATRVLDYAAEGYLPEALRNFVALIGWSPGDNREILTTPELVEAFDLKGLQPSPGRFDIDKLKWINGHFLRAMTVEELLAALLAYIHEPYTQEFWASFVPDPEVPGHKDIDPVKVWSGLKLIESWADKDPEYVKSALALEQQRVVKLSELGEACAFFFEEEPKMDEKAVAKWLTLPAVPGMFSEFADAISSSKPTTAEQYEELLKAYQVKVGLEKLGPVVHPTRVAMTGRTFGPGLFELMAVLGWQRVAERFLQAKAVAESLA